MVDPRRVDLMLDVLGQDTDEIAETMRCLGIYGVAMEPEACPLAIYLNRFCGVPGVRVTHNDVTWNEGKGRWTHEIGGTVSDFVAEVDLGDYPEIATVEDDDRFDDEDDYFDDWEDEDDLDDDWDD